jgi:hypothetical protein
MCKATLWNVRNGSLLKLSIGMSAALLILTTAVARPEKLAALFSLDSILTALFSESPTTEIMICRKADEG